MQVTLDENIVQKENIQIRYGSFWSRFGALLLDGIILAPISFGLTFYNIISLKSGVVFLLISLIGMVYKPMMEYSYGATLGKMALKLQVTNLEYERVNLQEVLLRNIFNIVPSLLITFMSFSMYSNPDFAAISSYIEYATFSQQFFATQFVSGASGLITIIEAIMIATDDQKRALHDRIAGTYVIEKP